MPSSYPPRPIHILDHVYKVIPDRQGYNDKITYKKITYNKA